MRSGGLNNSHHHHQQQHQQQQFPQHRHNQLNQQQHSSSPSSSPSPSASRRQRMEQIGVKIHELVGTSSSSSKKNKTNNNNNNNNNETHLIGKLQEWILESPESLFFQDVQHRTALHIACAFQAPLPIVQFLIHQEMVLLENLVNSSGSRYNKPTILPSILSKTTKGLLPIHYACREQGSLQVIQCLVNSSRSFAPYLPSTTNDNNNNNNNLSNDIDNIYNSGGLSAATKDGWLPLHMACARKAKTPVIDFLLQEYPQGAHIATHCGRYALHFACANRLEVSAVRSVYVAAPSVLHRPDKSEWNPLHVACAYSTLEVVAYLVDECWLDGLRVRGGGQDVQRLPLHLSCSERQPLEIVVHLVLAYRPAITELDANGLLPLHAAVKGGAPLEVIQFLISEWPTSAFQFGSTIEEIVSYICKRQKKSSSGNNTTNSQQQQQQFMQLQSWLERTVKDHEKKDVVASSSSPSTPVYIPSQQATATSVATFKKPPPPVQPPQCDNNIVARVSSGGSSRSSITGGSTATPAGIVVVGSATGYNDEEKFLIAGKRLHESCEMPQNLDAIQQILDDCPEAIDFTSYGHLPLHTACLNQANVDVLMVLHQFAQDAIRKRDSEGNLPIHLACYSSAPVDSIDYLLQHWPEAVRVLNANGETPLRRAANPFYDNPNPDIIGLLQRYEAQVDHEEQQLQQQQELHNRQHHNTSTGVATTTTSINSNTDVRRQQIKAKPAPEHSPILQSPPKVSPKVFKAPMGVDDVRAALDSIRATKVSTRSLDISIDEEDEEYESSDDGDDENEEETILHHAQHTFKKPPPGATPPPSSQTSPHQPSQQNRKQRPLLRRPSDSAGSSGSLRAAPPTTGLQRATPIRGEQPSSSSSQPDTSTSTSTSADPFAKAQRPGVVMVNEPGMRPDSAMYRAAYGSRESRPNSSRRTFDAPPGVQEVRGLVGAMRTTQQASRREIEGLDAHPQSSSRCLEGDGFQPPAYPASSFYQAALQESKAIEQKEDASSSFYRAALDATGSAPAGPSAAAAAAAPTPYSSFYMAAMAEASQQQPRTGTSDPFRLPVDSGGGQQAAGSFYREALGASSSHRGGGVGIDERNITATAAKRPGVVMVNEPGMNPSSAMYRAAYGSDEQNQQGSTSTRPGVVMVNEPGMNPSSAMYRAAYGDPNNNARSRQQYDAY